MIDHSTPARCIGIIPARYASSRFPGKPLADILGKPMFWHVYQRAKACPGLHQVVLATDDQRILQAAQAEGVPAIMTRDDHSSGTDRVLEAAETLELPAGSVVVNIQGDEPALVPELLSQLLLPFENPATQVSTLARGIDQHQAQKPDMVKVVMDSSGRALYFSRACIPYPRAEGAPFLGHIGLYAFRLETLRRFAAMGPGQLEQIEKLEQLRFLEAGIPIHVQLTRHSCHGVDRPEDIARVCKIMHEHTIQ